MTDSAFIHPYIPNSVPATKRAMLDAIGSKAELEIDGGIKPENAREVVDAGATVLVAGSAVFRGDVAASVRRLREAAGPR